MIIKFFKDKTDKTQDLNNKYIDDDIINVIALLLEASSIDGHIEKMEIDKIVEVISNYFKLDEETLKKYYQEAILIQENNTSFHNFTSKIHKKYNYSQKIDILEMLWEVVLVNKYVDDFESNLMRRISGLLHLKDVDSGLIKKKVQKKLKI